MRRFYTSLILLTISVAFQFVQLGQTDDIVSESVATETLQNSFSSMLGALFPGSYYERVYETIDKYLVKNVQSEDIESNMKKANDLLNLESSTSPNGTVGRKNLVAGLKQFTSLSRLQSKNECDGKSYSILLRNDRATLSRAHRRLSKLGPLSRVDKIVRHYSIQHARDCQQVYMKNYKIRKGKINQMLLHRVEIISMSMYEPYLREFNMNSLSTYLKADPIQALEFIFHFKMLRKTENKESAYLTLKFLSKNDPEKVFLEPHYDNTLELMVIHRVKINSLFNKYLVDPCVYYLTELGPDIFIPALFDIKVLDSNDYTADTEEAHQFYIGLGHYRMCNLVATYLRGFLATGVMSFALQKYDESAVP